MTDEQMVRLCHQALGYELESMEWPRWMIPWNPLTNDAQAMALVKKFHLQIMNGTFNPDTWIVTDSSPKSTGMKWVTNGLDLNRCICTCIAKMQQAKHDADSAG